MKILKSLALFSVPAIIGLSSICVSCSDDDKDNNENDSSAVIIPKWPIFEVESGMEMVAYQNGISNTFKVISVEEGKVVLSKDDHEFVLSEETPFCSSNFEPMTTAEAEADAISVLIALYPNSKYLVSPQEILGKNSNATIYRCSNQKKEGLWNF